MSISQISKKRLNEAIEKISNFRASTVRKFSTVMICQANLNRLPFSVYQTVADEISPPALRRKTLLSLSPAETAAVVDGFLDKTREEIEEISQNYMEILERLA